MFTIDGIIFDSILSAYAENFKGELLYKLTQLTDASIEVSADEKNATDKDGSIIKKSYRAKTVTLTATNAMLDLNAYAETTGTSKIVASSTNKIVAPKIITVPAPPTTAATGTVYPLPNDAKPITGSLQVVGLKATGSIAKKYTLSSASTSSEDEFAYNSTDNKVTVPTVQNNPEIVEFMIKYDYETENAVEVANYSNKWPKTIKLTLQALVFDQCETDVLRLCYVIFDSFQVDPQTTLSMTTDATFDFKGSAQANGCNRGGAKLYRIVMADNDVMDD